MRHIDPKHFATVCDTLASCAPGNSVYSVALILDARTVVRATWRHAHRARATRYEMVVTFGAPNYADRALIKRKHLFDGDGIVLPILYVRPWPTRRKS